MSDMESNENELDMGVFGDTPPELEPGAQEIPTENKVVASGNKILDAISGQYVKALCDQLCDITEIDYGSINLDIGLLKIMFDRYAGSNISTPAEIAEDIVKASALLVRISETLGFLQAQVSDIEPRTKGVISGLYTEIKELKQRGDIDITDKDAEHAARLLSHKYMKPSFRAVAAAKMLTHFWFGARSFVENLKILLVNTKGAISAEKDSTQPGFDFPPREHYNLPKSKEMGIKL